MAGELNGTGVVVQKGASPVTVTGQMDVTATFTVPPIVITNKSHGGYETTMDGESGTKQVTLACNITYNNSTEFSAIWKDAQSLTQDDYTLSYPDGRSVSGKFVPSGLADTLPDGDRVTSALTLMSSGEYTVTDPT